MATTANCASGWKSNGWVMCWPSLQTNGCAGPTTNSGAWIPLLGTWQDLAGSAFPLGRPARANGSTTGLRSMAGKRMAGKRMVGATDCWCGAASKSNRSMPTTGFMRPHIKPDWKLLYAWPDNAGRSNKPSKPPNRGPHGRVFVRGVEGRVRDGPLRSPPPARPVSAHRFVHAGVCNLGHSASPWRKKLHADKSHSACRNCAACSPTCCGEHGTALNIGCIGQAGGENIHFTRCATTIANKVPHYRSSIYNCGIRLRSPLADHSALPGAL